MTRVPEGKGFEEAGVLLGSGQVVGLPTDTVYGLAALASSESAVARLFELKERSPSVDVAVLVADAAQARALALDWPHPVDLLAREFWPGALTLVLSRRVGLDWNLGSSSESVGVRCPSHDGVRRLCAALGPLAVTSANIHGQPTPPDASGIRRIFGAGLALVVDGGRCDGLASTVVDCRTRPPSCLREGAVAWERVESVWPASLS
ncbi:MAG: L-threonylcarbamoyladenylate synthase [Acidimicrobiales bacterium]